MERSYQISAKSVEKLGFLYKKLICIFECFLPNGIYPDLSVDTKVGSYREFVCFILLTVYRRSKYELVQFLSPGFFLLFFPFRSG